MSIDLKACSRMDSFTAVHGVDFSGAKLAGRTTWVARLEPASRRGLGQDQRPEHAPGWALASLARLERLAGTAERGPALAHLVRLIEESQGGLWALDFPFGFPVSV